MGHVGLFTTRLCASDGTRNGRRTEAAEEERVRGEREGARRAQMEIKRRRVRSTRLFTAPRGRCHGERRKCGRATTPHCSHPAGRGREEAGEASPFVQEGRRSGWQRSKKRPLKRLATAFPSRASATARRRPRDCETLVRRRTGLRGTLQREKKTSPSVLVNHPYLPY